MKKILLPLVLVLVFVLAACGSSAGSEFPTGKFVKQGTEDYALEINEDGTYVVKNQGMVLARATYSVESNVFTETSNNGGCDTNVAFNYTFDGSNLTFTYVGNPEDDKACAGRYADFNNVTYVLQK
jgi:hypothetical protein